MIKSWTEITGEKRKPNAVRNPLHEEELQLFRDVGAILGETTLREFENCVEALRNIKHREATHSDLVELERLCGKYGSREPLMGFEGPMIVVGE